MKILDNTCIAIFGASGDLTKRKLIPSLYRLYQGDFLPKDFAILGISRTSYTDEEYRANLTQAMPEEMQTQEAFTQFLAHIYYQPIDTAKVEDYALIKQRLEKLEQIHHTAGNVLFYLATPPSLYAQIPHYLAAQGLHTQDHGWKRLIVEKPFGYDLASAVDLDAQLYQHFDEDQIYRIDHYLGKETVQNLLVLRFANGIFEPLWNSHYIQYVEITSSESLGVENRGGYYDGAGAMRDMFQNHLLQVLALVAMESPAVEGAQAMRNEVVKVLQSLRPLDEEDIENNLVLGQYLGAKIRGKDVLGYREEKGVAPDSRTETFLGLKLNIDNWRWNNVPFYVRVGKRLPTRVTEIVIHFNRTPHPMFRTDTAENKLIIRIQPDEGIVMSFGMKKPGAGFSSQEVSMDFKYDELQHTSVVNAYERLLLDAIQGDATLFARSDAVRACWKFVQPIIDYKEKNPHLYGYASGTWGPIEATQLIQRDNRTWRMPCKNLTNTEYCEL